MLITGPSAVRHAVRSTGAASALARRLARARSEGAKSESSKERSGRAEARRRDRSGTELVRAQASGSGGASSELLSTHKRRRSAQSKPTSTARVDSVQHVHTVRAKCIAGGKLATSSTRLHTAGECAGVGEERMRARTE